MSLNMSIRLFNKALDEVGAYRDFLNDHNFRLTPIHTKAEFLNIPIMDKKNYLQKYQLWSLMARKDHDGLLYFCATSGSTGEPYYFPRNDQLSRQYSLLIQEYLLQTDADKSKRTLVLVGFGLGVWIGGVITLRAFEIAAQQLRYPLSILPVGYNKAEMMKALRLLSPQFDQTIIVGYPPFVKQIVDESQDEGIDLSEINIRFLFAAESFTESFRDYLCEKAQANPLLDTLNIYGTADIGAMAYETPFSIMVRRLAAEDKRLFASIFGQIEKTPTLAQYNHKYISFEAVDGQVILSGQSALPLIRYAVGDHGGVISFRKLLGICRRHGYDLMAEARDAGIAHTILQRPFVYVYERKNFSATLHGIVIYPEFIKEALISPSLAESTTGRFTMLTRYDKRQNQYLEVNVEMRPTAKITGSLARQIDRAIIGSLSQKSSEFLEIVRHPGGEALIQSVLWPQDHPKYFSLKSKQKWAADE